MYNVYDIRENKRTNNFFGYELIVDGERGYENYPGRWDPAEAKRHYMRGIPWDAPLKDAHTYTIELNGQYYALAADMFLTTVYAIGPDRQNGKENACYYIGSVQERNDAIRSVCIPHDAKTTFRIARDNGIYTGMLYNK